MHSLQRLVVELVNHAYKYTPLHELITLRVEAIEQQITLSVTNTGVEIPADAVTLNGTI